MVFLLFDQMHGEIVGFLQRRVGLRAGRATCEFEPRHRGTKGNAVVEAQAGSANGEAIELNPLDGRFYDAALLVLPSCRVFVFWRSGEECGAVLSSLHS
ncbi:MAG TPA: hypothetical protein VN901_16170 [Candidatus Acidoferrales bacterium]|nr:hypothetical protein [Candidatus Acidoferrales bacterium]